MSNMYNNYTENNIEDEEEPEPDIEDAVAQWVQDKEDRYVELLNFIDDFVASKEYEQYLERKKNIIKVSVSTQYSASDFAAIKTKLTLEERFPLTVYSRKMIAFIGQFQNYIYNQMNLDMLMKQMKGIQMIKHRIANFKRCTLLHAYAIKRKRDAELTELLEEFCELFNLDWKKVGTKNRKILEKIGSFTKMLRTRYINKKRNYQLIAKKIADEIKREKKLMMKPNKKIFPKICKFEKIDWIQKDLEIIGLEPERKFRDSQDTDIPEEQEQGEAKKVCVQTYKPIQLEISASPQDDWSQISSVDIFPKMSQTSNISDVSATTKTNKKQKQQEKEVLVVPIPRIKNTRKKITADDITNMSNLLEQFKRFDEIMEMEYIARNPSKTKKYHIDKKILCRPKAIFFNNYEAGKTYKRMLKVQNIGFETRKYRFVQINTEDKYDALFFEVAPLTGIQKVVAGCSDTLFITFKPEADGFEYHATLEFLSFDYQTQEQQKFYVEVKCMPKIIDFKISTTDIDFGKVRFYEKKSGFKKITLSNDGVIPCRAIIKKAKDVLGVDEEMEIVFDSTAVKKGGGDERTTAVSEVLDQILETVFDRFEFERYCINLPKWSSKTLKVHMKNFEHLGDYFEKYNVELYNYKHKLIGTAEVSLHGEVIGHFIRTIPEQIDFGVCMINSTYQTQVEIENMSSSTQAVAVKIPSSVSEYVKSSVTNIFLPPKSSRTVWIRLFPRKAVTTSCYYKQEYSILEFPVHVCVLTNNHADIAPVKVVAYAVVTTSNFINIIPTNEACTKYDTNGIYLNLGDCSLFETVLTDIILENKSLAPQVYGFLDVPKGLTITPNYGFGVIQSGEQKILTLHFHPDYQELLKKMNEKRCKDFEMKFKISVETLCNIRDIKKAIDSKRLRTSINIILKELKRPKNSKLFEDIYLCIKAVNKEFYPPPENNQAALDESLINESVDGETDEEENDPAPERYETEVEENLTEINYNSISLYANVVKPLIEISGQYFVLPDTPCNSFSSINFEIKALKLEFSEETPFLKYRDLKLPKYEAWFRITGDNKQIRVEPSCGILKNGEKRKIFLIVKPEPPEDVVTDFAKSIRYVEIYKMRFEAFEESIKKAKLLTPSKEKKALVNISNLPPQPPRIIPKEILGGQELDPAIKVSETELILSPEHYFPAEMYYWRSLEPYTISSKLTCTINYESKIMRRKKDVLYINVSCKVVRPDFILNNMKFQCLNFGNVVVGMKKTMYIPIQNIKYHPIKIKVSLLDPLGPFRVPYLKSSVVPPEGYLKLPVYFEPTQVHEKIDEFFEISSGRTIVPLKIQGAGVPCEIAFEPSLQIVRLCEATSKKLDELHIKVKNLSEGPVTVSIEKAFEIEGTIFKQDVSMISNASTISKISKMSRSASYIRKPKEGKEVKRFSAELNQEEICSVADFQTSTESHFLILNHSQTITLEPHSSDTFTIAFGMKELLGQKIDVLSSGASRISRHSNTSERDISTLEQSPNYSYIAKYNFRARSTFKKDYIIIGSIK